MANYMPACQRKKMGRLKAEAHQKGGKHRFAPFLII